MTAPSFATQADYLAEVKRLLLEKGLEEKWVDELIDGDAGYLALAFERGDLAVASAFEVYMTEEESQREPEPSDPRLKVDVTDQARTYLQDLVKMGLWGDSVEGVAANLLHQQLAAKLEVGLLSVRKK